MNDRSGGIHHTDPFATPAELREPARRLRGRLVAPVTIWTAGTPELRAGLTVSSALVAEGDPSLALGLVADTTELWDALLETGAFVVHVLERRDRVLADVFAGLRPSPGGVFTNLDVEDTAWGPVLRAEPVRAYCRVASVVEAGYQRLVSGEIEKIENGDLERPLAYFRGRYRELAGDEGVRPG